jgi:exodeoxyribonuclease VII small subunit
MSKKLTLEELLSVGEPKELLASIDFEDGLKLLSSLCEQIESGELPLAAAVTSYERGSQLLVLLRNQLTQAEEKIRIIQPTAFKEDSV